MQRRMPNKLTVHNKTEWLEYYDDTGLGRFWTTVQIGSNEWFKWLDRGDTFYFSTLMAHMTVRREKRRNTYYYYGFRADDKKKLHKIYLGTSDKLTYEYLVSKVNELGKGIN